MVNIFEQATNKDQDVTSFEESFWVQWKTLGDKIQGTFLRQFEVEDRIKGEVRGAYQFRGAAGAKASVGNTLMDLSGKLFNVGARPIIDREMADVEPGQIIGLEFIAETPNKKAGFSPVKIIKVYKNKDLRDPNFKAPVQVAGSVTSPNATLNPPVPSFAPTPAELEAKIKLLAIKKIPTATEQTYQNDVMNMTGLAYIPNNYQKILDWFVALP